MNWWLWLAGGLALVVAELVTPSGFFIIFFGLGALTVGVLATLEILTSGWMQWLVFTVLSVAYLLLFRGRFQARFEMPPPPNVDSLVGGLAVMFPAMNVDDRTELLGGMRATAPAEAFAGVWSLAKSVLSVDDHRAVAVRLGLA